MLPDPGTNHDPVGIDGLAVAAVTLAGTNGAEETVFREDPHGITYNAYVLK